MPHINLEASVQSNYVSSVTERYLFLHETVTKPNVYYLFHHQLYSVYKQFCPKYALSITRGAGPGLP